VGGVEKRPYALPRERSIQTGASIEESPKERLKPSVAVHGEERKH